MDTKWSAYIPSVGREGTRGFQTREDLPGLTVQAPNAAQALDRVAEILNEQYQLGIVRTRRTSSIPVLGLGSICVERVR